MSAAVRDSHSRSSTGQKSRKSRPVWDRFFEKVDASGDCWEWTAYRLKSGYGTFAVSKNKSTTAYRVCWNLLVGEIPDGMELDHLCFNRGCVNPDHLEVVTRAENIRRQRWSHSKALAAQTHCKNGHEFTDENTIVKKNGRGCRACKAAEAAKPESLARQRKYVRAWHQRNPDKQREYNSRRKPTPIR